MNANNANNCTKNLTFALSCFSKNLSNEKKILFYKRAGVFVGIWREAKFSWTTNYVFETTNLSLPSPGFIRVRVKTDVFHGWKNRWRWFVWLLKESDMKMIIRTMTMATKMGVIMRWWWLWWSYDAYDRHDICHIFYTSNFSNILNFTRRKRVNRNIFSPLIWRSEFS